MRRALTAAETQRIIAMDADGKSPRRIAAELNRALSTVTREIRELRDRGVIVRPDRRNRVYIRGDRVYKRRERAAATPVTMPFGRCTCGSEVALLPREAGPTLCCNCRAAHVERVIALRRRDAA